MTIDEMLAKANTVAIFGHVRPDGDCVGSTVAMYNYIKDNYPQIEATVFLDPFLECLGHVEGASSIVNNYDGRDIDLAFLMDAPTFARVGAGGEECLKKAKFTCNIDHHIANPLNLCSENFVEPEISSTCELLYTLLDKSKISVKTASCLYLGIVHDTGAFKFSNTSKSTMDVVGNLIEKGVDFSRIINETYYTRSYKQALVTGHVMQKSKLALNGKVIYSFITTEELEEFNIEASELNTVIDTLREVSGTEATIFIYPVKDRNKISLRSNYVVDVNAIAQKFGGGGHVRAAGGDTGESAEVVIPKLIDLIAEQLNSN